MIMQPARHALHTRYILQAENSGTFSIWEHAVRMTTFVKRAALSS